MILEIKNNDTNIKNFIIFFLGLMISIPLIIFSLKNFNYNVFIKSIQNANYMYLYLSIAILFLTIQLRAIRWNLLLNKKVALNKLYIAQLIGYAGNNLLPLRAGEFIKSFYLEKKVDISKFNIFGTVVLERILDLFSLLVLFMFLFQSKVYTLINDYNFNLILAIAVLVFSVLSLSFYIRNPIKINLYKKLPSLVTDIIEGFSTLNCNNFIYVNIISMLIWFNYAIVVYLVQCAFSLNLDLYQTILLLVLPSIALSIPSLPGNIGTFEGSVVYTLSLCGIEDTFGFGFILHSISFIPYTLFGLIYFIKERRIFLNE